MPAHIQPVQKALFYLLIAITLVLPDPCLSGTEDSGFLHCFIFVKDSGLRPADLSVEILDSRYPLADDGSLMLSLPAGRYTAIVTTARGHIARISCPIAAGETTEVLVTLNSDGTDSSVDMETPAVIESEHATPSQTDLIVGFLEGSIVDIEKHEPIEGARIFFRGLPDEAITTGTGTFRVELPVGSHAMSIIHARYATQTIEPLVIVPDEPVRLTVELTPTAVELEEYRVLAIRIEGGIASLIEERKLSANVTDIIGAEEISKSGDSDAAAALKRVTGLTVVGGKYVYVRGMGERYSSSLLNGASIPSPEPERRVVPLDLFPVDVLEGIEIQKTFSPDMPSEFGGGTVKIRTKSIPAEFLLNVSESNGYNESTTGKQGFTYNGGSTDWLGIDDGTRLLPDVIRNTDHIHVGTPNYPGYTREEIEAFGESLPDVWTVDDFTVPLALGFSLSAGNSHDLGAKSTLGYLFSFTYNNSWQNSEMEYNNYGVADGNLTANDSYLFTQTTRNIDLGSILSMGLDVGENNQIRLTSLVLRITEDRARFYEGLAGDQDDFIQVNSLRWVEQMLWTEQLTGHHVMPFFGDLAVDWSYTYSLATRDEPDRRDVKYEYDAAGGGYRLSTLSDGNHRIFSELDGNTNDISVSVAKPFSLWRELESSIRLGGGYVTRNRVVDTRRFTFNRGSLISLDMLNLPPEELFSAENIKPNGMELQESTLKTDHYEANQTISSAFLMMNLQLSESIDVMTGARIESSEQTVDTFALHSTTDNLIQSELKTTDILPALTTTWKFHDQMQVRAAFSQTVSRPDFRELSPAQYNDVVGGREVVGNPDLKRALIDNYDLRYEWYPTANESLSLGLFYKNFTDPIEHTIDGGSNSQMSYVNAPGAQNYGIELEFRKNLENISEILSDLTISGNIAFITSEVQLDENAGEETSKNRPLEGQSPYVVNVSIGYDNPDNKRNLAILYNTFGKRIVNVGYGGLPDVYEQPFHYLDLVAATPLFAGITLKIKIKNILDQETRFTQDDQITEKYATGRSISLGLSWSW